MKFRLWKNHPKSCQQKRTDPRSELQFPRPRPTSLHHRTAATSSFFLSCSAPWFSDSSSSTLPFYFPQMAIHLPHLTQGISQPLWFWFLSSAPLLFFLLLLLFLLFLWNHVVSCALTIIFMWWTLHYLSSPTLTVKKSLWTLESDRLGVKYQHCCVPPVRLKLPRPISYP